jgi:hypothetical protein
MPCVSGALAVADGLLYKVCHDNLFLTEGCFFFTKLLVFQASIVCKLCSAASCNENCYLSFVLLYAFHPILGMINKNLQSLYLDVAVNLYSCSAC